MKHIKTYEKLNNTTVGEYYLVNVPYYSIKNGTIPEYVEQLCQLEKILPESLAPDEYKYVVNVCNEPKNENEKLDFFGIRVSILNIIRKLTKDEIDEYEVKKLSLKYNI